MSITNSYYWPLGSTISKSFTNINVGSGYEHFGFLSVNPVTGNIILIFRKGTSFASDIGSIWMRKSTDGGANWGSEIQIKSETQVDLRNIAGGYTSSGRLLLFYGRYQNNSSWLPIGYIYSDNDGSTWSNQQQINTQSGTSAFSPYGSVIDIGGGVLFQTWYEVSSGVYTLKFSKSTDNGNTFLTSNIFSIYSSNLTFTEPSMLNLGGGCLLVLSRINNGTCFAQFRSNDYGITWNSIPEYTNFDTWTNGQNSPYLSYINYNGIGIVACYYLRRDSSPYPIKVVYGLASDIVNNGISGWNPLTLRTVLSSTGGSSSGCPSFFHPNNQLKGIGNYFDCGTSSSHPVIIFTPTNNIINGVFSNLMP